MHIGLFLTYGNSLNLWRDAGILDREVAIYQEHVKNGCAISIVSYGREDEEQFQRCYQGLKVIPNRRSLPTKLYGYLIPYLTLRALETVDVIKTNQMYGAHVAASSATKLKRPLYIRQGYSFFESERGRWGEKSKQAKAARAYESEMAQRADWLTLPSKSLVAAFVDRNPSCQEKISVLPNYVEEATWHPGFKARSRKGPLNIGYLGKFTEQKNLAMLIEACMGLEVELTFIGDGPLETQLKAIASKKSVSVKFHGRLHQAQARDILRGCDCFILASNYEGQPKALIEAMTFGMPVIGTKIEGITDLINDGATGFLAELSVQGIRDAIIRVMNAELEYLERIGSAARAFVLENHELKQIVEDDFKIIQKLVAHVNA